MKYLKPLELYQGLLKSNVVKSRRLLGLDVGDKYVGLSVSDANNKIASPLSVLVRKKTNMDLMSTDFQTMVSELSLDGLVIGYPFDRQKSSPNAMQVKLFVDDLNKTGKLEDLNYTYWDECFTSKEMVVLLGLAPLFENSHSTVMKFIFLAPDAIEDSNAPSNTNVELLLKPLAFHPVQKKTIMDKFAAVGILQGYLDFVSRDRGLNQETEKLCDEID